MTPQKEQTSQESDFNLELYADHRKQTKHL